MQEIVKNKKSNNTIPTHLFKSCLKIYISILLMFSKNFFKHMSQPKMFFKKKKSKHYFNYLNYTKQETFENKNIGLIWSLFVKAY